MLESLTVAVATAGTLALIVMVVTEYLVAPLKNTPKIAAWLVKIGLAYRKGPDASVGDDITIWVIPYITFAFGALLSYLLGLDIMTDLLGIDTAGLTAKLLTAVVVGGGSNVIHRITNGGK